MEQVIIKQVAEDLNLWNSIEKEVKEKYPKGMVYEIVKSEYLSKGGKMMSVVSSQKKRKMSSQDIFIDNSFPDYNEYNEEDEQEELQDFEEQEDENDQEEELQESEEQENENDQEDENDQEFKETFKDKERLTNATKELSDTEKTVLKLFTESQNFYNLQKTNENYFFYLEVYKYIINFFRQLKESKNKVKSYGRVSEKLIADSIIFYYSNLDNSQLKLRREFVSTKTSKQNNIELFSKMMGLISKYPNMTITEFVETSAEELLNLRILNNSKDDINDIAKYAIPLKKQKLDNSTKITEIIKEYREKTNENITQEQLDYIINNLKIEENLFLKKERQVQSSKKVKYLELPNIENNITKRVTTNPLNNVVLPKYDNNVRKYQELYSLNEIIPENIINTIEYKLDYGNKEKDIKEYVKNSGLDERVYDKYLSNIVKKFEKVTLDESKEEDIISVLIQFLKSGLKQNTENKPANITKMYQFFLQKSKLYIPYSYFYNFVTKHFKNNKKELLNVSLKHNFSINNEYIIDSKIEQFLNKIISNYKEYNFYQDFFKEEELNFFNLFVSDRFEIDISLEEDLFILQKVINDYIVSQKESTNININTFQIEKLKDIIINLSSFVLVSNKVKGLKLKKEYHNYYYPLTKQNVIKEKIEELYNTYIVNNTMPENLKPSISDFYVILFWAENFLIGEIYELSNLTLEQTINSLVNEYIPENLMSIKNLILETERSLKNTKKKEKIIQAVEELQLKINGNEISNSEKIVQEEFFEKLKLYLISHIIISNEGAIKKVSEKNDDRVFYVSKVLKYVDENTKQQIIKDIVDIVSSLQEKGIIPKKQFKEEKIQQKTEKIKTMFVSHKNQASKVLDISFESYFYYMSKYYNIQQDVSDYILKDISKYIYSYVLDEQDTEFNVSLILEVFTNTYFFIISNQIPFSYKELVNIIFFIKVCLKNAIKTKEKISTKELYSLIYSVATNKISIKRKDEIFNLKINFNMDKFIKNLCDTIGYVIYKNIKEIFIIMFYTITLKLEKYSDYFNYSVEDWIKLYISGLDENYLSLNPTTEKENLLLERHIELFSILIFIAEYTNIDEMLDILPIKDKIRFLYENDKPIFLDKELGINKIKIIKIAKILQELKLSNYKNLSNDENILINVNNKQYLLAKEQDKTLGIYYIYLKNIDTKKITILLSSILSKVIDDNYELYYLISNVLILSEGSFEDFTKNKLEQEIDIIKDIYSLKEYISLDNIENVIGEISKTTSYVIAIRKVLDFYEIYNPMFEYQNDIILGKERSKTKAIQTGINLLKKKYTDYFDTLLYKINLEFENKEIILQPLENYTELIVEYINTPLDKKDEIWLRQREPYTVGIKPYYTDQNTISSYVEDAYKKVLELFTIKSIPEFLRKKPDSQILKILNLMEDKEEEWFVENTNKPSNILNSFVEDFEEKMKIEEEKENLFDKYKDIVLKNPNVIMIENNKIQNQIKKEDTITFSQLVSIILAFKKEYYNYKKIELNNSIIIKHRNSSLMIKLEEPELMKLLQNL